MKEQNEHGQNATGQLVRQCMPGLKGQSSAQENCADDESAVAHHQTKIAEVPEGNDQQEDIYENEGREKIIVEKIVGIMNAASRQGEYLLRPAIE